MNTNQTPAASASRHAPEPWTRSGQFLKQGEVYVAEFFTQSARGLQTTNGPAMAERALQEHNALAGMEPGAVAALVAAAEWMDAHYSGSLDHQPGYVAAIRAALSALKGGAK